MHLAKGDGFTGSPLSREARVTFVTLFSSISMTGFIHSGLFVRSFASLALKDNHFSIFLVNGIPDGIVMIYTFITNIFIIKAFNSGVVVSIAPTTNTLITQINF